MRYYPGRYARYALNSLFQSLSSRFFSPPPSKPDPPDPELEANVLLFTLFHAGHTDFRNTAIIILCEPHLTDALYKTVNSDYREYAGAIVTVPIIGFTEDNSYILDDHPTSTWHKQTADMVIPYIQ